MHEKYGMCLMIFQLILRVIFLKRHFLFNSEIILLEFYLKLMKHSYSGEFKEEP